MSRACRLGSKMTKYSTRCRRCTTTIAKSRLATIFLLLDHKEMIKRESHAAAAICAETRWCREISGCNHMSFLNCWAAFRMIVIRDADSLVSVPLFLAAMVCAIIGTHYTPGFYFFFGLSNCELRFSVPIVIVPSVDNRCVAFRSWILKSRMCFTSFSLIGRGTTIPSSAWSFSEQECKRRWQFKLLLDLTLDLFDDHRVWICMDNCAATATTYVSWRHKLFGSVRIARISNISTLPFSFMICESYSVLWEELFHLLPLVLGFHNSFHQDVETSACLSWSCSLL